MKTSFLLLSAGQSSRMGQDKALLDFHGRFWLVEQATEIFKSGVVDRLVVVTQSERADSYRKILEPLRTLELQIEVIENSDPKSKPSDSIRCALKAMSFPVGAFISPIDVCQKSEILQMIAGSLDSQSQVVKPELDGKTGHPIWMSQEQLRLFFESVEERLDFYLAHNKACVEWMSVKNPEIFSNLNTPEAWSDFLKATAGSVFIN